MMVCLYEKGTAASLDVIGVNIPLISFILYVQNDTNPKFLLGFSECVTDALYWGLG